MRMSCVRGRGAAALAVTMTAVPTVPAMHEQVHEGAGEDQQKREKPERVGSVFGEKQECPDQQETDRHKARPGSPKPRRRSVRIVLAIAVCRYNAMRALIGGHSRVSKRLTIS
jgi:hypothetical protein